MDNATAPANWAVFDANGGTERRITSAGTRQTAEVLRDLYLHCTPDAHPAEVFVTGPQEDIMAPINIDMDAGGAVRPLHSTAANLTEDVQVIRRDLGQVAGMLASPDMDPGLAVALVQLVSNVGMLESNVADLAASVEHHTDNGGSS